MAEFLGPFICPSLHRLGMLLRAAYILRNKCLADDTDINAIGESELNLRRTISSLAIAPFAAIAISMRY